MDFDPDIYQNADFAFADTPVTNMTALALQTFKKGGAHSSHPDFGHLVLLVFEAVMEVVAVALPGYIVARIGMFDGNSQKFVANLNMTLFTPCLIFSKLAKQLSGDKLLELIVIPIILLVQTCVSYLSAKIVCKIFKLNKKPQNNFVTAMAVFGNSNSLPLSLVISLSHTISGLHWSKIPGDNDDEVGARGILYLLIFSQLGQALRWSWGMNSLLRPLDTYTPAERGEVPYDDEALEPYRDDPVSSSSNSVLGTSSGSSVGKDNVTETPVHTSDEVRNGNHQSGQMDGAREEDEEAEPSQTEQLQQKLNVKLSQGWQKAQKKSNEVFHSLPESLQKGLNLVGSILGAIFSKIWACLNVPLAAIIVSVVVAVVPPLKAFFFTEGIFVRNSVTRAIEQSGGVAVPLILVVLGANLARNTLPDEGKITKQYKREERNMLIASLVCRMLLPTIIMAPILAIMAKFIPISIFDDPIFLIVCFLLTGAPSALQLAQMCQVNSVYVGAVSRLLFHSYVVWILPSTLILVMLALETVEWVDAGNT